MRPELRFSILLAEDAQDVSEKLAKRRRADKTIVGDSRKWTVTSTSKGGCPPWETTPASGRGRWHPITRQ